MKRSQGKSRLFALMLRNDAFRSRRRGHGCNDVGGRWSGGIIGRFSGVVLGVSAGEFKVGYRRRRQWSSGTSRRRLKILRRHSGRHFSLSRWRRRFSSVFRRRIFMGWRRRAWSAHFRFLWWQGLRRIFGGIRDDSRSFVSGKRNKERRIV